jgi:predicted enzyme related to lactoylglutathione lyase
MGEPGSGPIGTVEVAIVVSDLDAASRFYESTLGLTHVADWDMPDGTMKRLQHDDLIVKLLAFAETPKSSGPGGFMAGVTGFRYLTISVEDVAATQQKVADAGFNVVIPDVEFAPGVHIAIVEDPDGNWIEFISSTR